MTHAATPAGHYGSGPQHPGYRPDPQHPGYGGDPLYPGLPERASPVPSEGYRPRAQYGPPPGYDPSPAGYDWRDAPIPVRVPPPAPPAAPAPAESSAPVDAPDEEAEREEARRWASLRYQVACRTKTANNGHMNRADLAFGTPKALGPHGILWFFASAAPEEPFGFRIDMLQRLWYSSPDTDALPELLVELAEVAKGNIASAAADGRRWHPAGPEGSMVNGRDVTLPPGAQYVGVGVSTLDSEDGRWYQVAEQLRAPVAPGHRSRSAYDLKGRGFALLTDDTALRILRDPHGRVGDDGIRSNKPLDANRPDHWHNPHANLTEQGDQETLAIWRGLGTLHAVLTDYLCGRPA
ncbi:hypothetical protein [Micromonospora sp. WMMD1082]|uniref:hypothetical protein n=1 Tax=Micromonospora sp. WMMD1082 TaxID=3016104 RepID=UPI002415F008|nr:hypothetical protein [Micromonospora sp. WMMD1082]MDG4795175.1 hypothetical protein [Micromonospora sp. WMMD1082]